MQKQAISTKPIRSLEDALEKCQMLEAGGNKIGETKLRKEIL